MSILNNLLKISRKRKSMVMLAMLSFVILGSVYRLQAQAPNLQTPVVPNPKPQAPGTGNTYVSCQDKLTFTINGVGASDLVRVYYEPAPEKSCYFTSDFYDVNINLKGSGGGPVYNVDYPPTPNGLPVEMRRNGGMVGGYSLQNVYLLTSGSDAYVGVAANQGSLLNLSNTTNKLSVQTSNGGDESFYASFRFFADPMIPPLTGVSGQFYFFVGNGNNVNAAASVQNDGVAMNNQDRIGIQFVRQPDPFGFITDPDVLDINVWNGTGWQYVTTVTNLDPLNPFVVPHKIEIFAYDNGGNRNAVMTQEAGGRQVIVPGGHYQVIITPSNGTTLGTPIHANGGPIQMNGGYANNQFRNITWAGISGGIFASHLYFNDIHYKAGVDPSSMHTYNNGDVDNGPVWGIDSDDNFDRIVDEANATGNIVMPFDDLNNSPPHTLYVCGYNPITGIESPRNQILKVYKHGKPEPPYANTDPVGYCGGKTGPVTFTMLRDAEVLPEGINRYELQLYSGALDLDVSNDFQFSPNRSNGSSPTQFSIVSNNPITTTVTNFMAGAAYLIGDNNNVIPPGCTTPVADRVDAAANAQILITQTAPPAPLFDLLAKITTCSGSQIEVLPSDITQVIPNDIDQNGIADGNYKLKIYGTPTGGLPFASGNYVGFIQDNGTDPYTDVYAMSPPLFSDQTVYAQIEQTQYPSWQCTSDRTQFDVDVVTTYQQPVINTAVLDINSPICNGDISPTNPVVITGELSLGHVTGFQVVKEDLLTEITTGVSFTYNNNTSPVPFVITIVDPTEFLSGDINHIYIRAIDGTNQNCPPGAFVPISFTYRNLADQVLPPSVSVAAQEVCVSGNATYTVNPLPPNATNVRLYRTPTGGNQVGLVTTNGNDFLLKTPNVTTTTSFYVAGYDELTDCESLTRTEIVLTVNPKPPAPVTLPAVLCNYGSANLTVSYPLPVQDFRFYTSTTGMTPFATVTSASTSNPYLGYASSPLITTTTSFYASMTDVVTGCESDRTELEVRVRKSEISKPLVDSLTFCSTATGQISVTFTATMGQKPGSYIALYTADSSTLITTDFIAPYELVVPASMGPLVGMPVGITNTYYVRVETGNGCNSPMTPVTVTAHGAITSPPMGYRDVQICSGSTATFVTTIAMPAKNANGFRLYTMPSGGVPDTITHTGPNYPLTVTNVTVTTNYFIDAYNTITGCTTPLRSGVTAVVNTTPETPSVGAIDFCGTQILTFTVTGNVLAAPNAPSDYKIALYTSATAANPVNTVVVPQSHFSVQISTPDVVFTTTTYYVELVSPPSSGCSSKRVPVVATKQGTLALPAALDVTVCAQGPNTPVTFTVTSVVPTDGGVKLYSSPTATSPLTAVTAAPYMLTYLDDFPVNLKTIRSYWLETYSATYGCSTNLNRVEVKVTANSVPSGGTLAVTGAPDFTVCGSSKATFLVNGLSANATGIRLYDSPTSTSILASTNVINDGYYMVTTPQQVGASRFYYIAEYNEATGCVQQVRTPVPVYVAGNISNPSIAAISRCGEGVVTFTVNNATSNSEVRLYTSSVPYPGETPIATDNVAPFWLTTGQVTTTTTYYVISATSGNNSNDGCESGRVGVVVTINAIPDAPVVSYPARRCGPGEVTFAVNDVPNGQVVRLYDYLSNPPSANQAKGTPISSDNFSPFEVKTQPVNNTELFHLAAYNQQTGCESIRTEAYATINTVPSTPIIDNLYRCGTGKGTFTVKLGAVPAIATSNHLVRLYTTSNATTPFATDNNSPYEFTTINQNTTTSYWFTVYDGTTNIECESPRQEAVLNIITRPSDITTVEDVKRCGTGKVTFSPKLSAANGIEVRLWNNNFTNNETDIVAFSKTAPYELTTGDISGTVIYYIEVYNPAIVGCESSNRIPVKAIAGETPGAPTATTSAFTVCGVGSVTLEAAMGSPSGNTLEVYTQSSGGNPVAQDLRTTGPWYVKTDVTTNTTLYLGAKVSTTGCASTDRTPVSVFVRSGSRPSTPTLTNKSGRLICGATSGVIQAMMGSIPGNVLRLYTVETGGSPAQLKFTTAGALFDVRLDQAVDYYVSAYNSVTGCESDRAKISIRGGFIPDAPTVIVDALGRCGGGSVVFTADINSIGGNQVRIYANQTGGAPIRTYTTSNGFFGLEALVETPFVVTNTRFYISGYDSNNGCESTTRTAITVSVNSTPQVPLVTNVVKCNAGIVSIPVKMQEPAGTVIRLYTQSEGGNPVSQSSATEGTDVTYHVSAGNLHLGQHYFYVAVSQGNNGCESARVPVEVTVTTGVQAPSNITSTVAGCASGKVTFESELGSVSSSLRRADGVRLYATATSTDFIAQDNTLPYQLTTPTLATTTNFYIATYDEMNGCESERVLVVAEVTNNGPSMPSMTGSADCAIANEAATLTAEMGEVSGNEIRLYKTATGGVPVSVAASAPYQLTTAVLTTNTTVFIAAATGTCESARRAVSLRVNPDLLVRVSGNGNPCGTGTVTLNVENVPSGATVYLYSTSTGGSYLTSDATAPYTLQASISTVTNFWVSAVSGNCATSRKMITTGLSGGAAGNLSVANEDVAVCNGSRATYHVNLNGFGTEVRMYASQAGTTPVAVVQGVLDNTQPVAIQTESLNNTRLFYISAFDANTGCETSRIPVTARVAVPGTPQLGNTTVTRCGAGRVAFSGFMSAPAGSELRLYPSSSGGTPFDTDNLPDNNGIFTVWAPSFDGASRTYYVAAAVGVCESQRVPVTVIVANGPSKPSASNIEVCGGGQAVITAVLGTGSATEVRLYNSETGGQLLGTANRAPYELRTPSINGVTTYWIAAANADCETERVPVAVSLGAQPTQPVPVSANVNFCGLGSASFGANMGTVPATELRLFTQAVGGAPIDVDNTVPYEVTTNTLTTTTRFYLAVGTGNCESPRVAVTATGIPAITAPIVEDVANCGSGSVKFTVSTGAGLVSAVRLYQTANGGTPIAVDNGFPYELTSPGVTQTTVFYVASVSGSCESPRTAVSAIIGATLSLPTVSNVTACGGGAASIQPIVQNVNGLEVRLYDQPIGGTVLAQSSSAPFTLKSPVLTTSTRFWVAAATSSCESPRAEVNVTVIPAPGISVDASNITCANMGSIFARVNAEGLYTYSLAALGSGSNSTNSTGSFSGLNAGVYVITATGNGCVVNSNPVTINDPNGPSNLTVSNVGNTSAILNWNAPGLNAVGNYEVRYRVLGSAGAYVAIKPISSTATSQLLSELNAGTNYEVDIRALCSNGRTSEWAGTTFRTTDATIGQGDCVTPTNVSVSTVSANAANISWTPNASGAVAYIIAYGRADQPSNTWNQFLVEHPTNNLTVNDLTPGFEYAVTVRTNCSAVSFRTGEITAPSVPVSFRTSLTKVSELSNEISQLSVYPNPNSGQFNVAYDAMIQGIVEMQIMDVSGRNILLQKLDILEGRNEIPVDITGNPAGMYFVRFIQDNQIRVMKIILR